MEKWRLKKLVTKALFEDMPWGDITSDLLIPIDKMTSSKLMAKSKAVLCGIDPFLMAFEVVDPNIKAEVSIPEGSWVKFSDSPIKLSGAARAMLKAERVAMNFLTHMSGIATQTRYIVEAIKGTCCRVTATRKTLPLLREIQRYAVVVGGGIDHRMDLSSSIIIKDNHIAALRGISSAVIEAKKHAPHTMKIEVEVTSLEGAKVAIDAGADIILLDNMNPDQIREIINIAPKNITMEASGGINLDNCRSFAEAGVHIISIGALTHSIKSADFSLEFD